MHKVKNVQNYVDLKYITKKVWTEIALVRICSSAVSINFNFETAVINVHIISHGRTAVAQLVEALRYKSEGRGFDSRWCHWNFSLT